MKDRTNQEWLDDLRGPGRDEANVHRMSALFLAGAGAYLVYYWLFIAGF